VVEGEKERPEKRAGDWGGFDVMGSGHEHLVGGRGPQLHRSLTMKRGRGETVRKGWSTDEKMELTRDDDRFFSACALMASFTDWSLMPMLPPMLGGQRRVRHTILDGGHDGVRLQHRQESPRTHIADSAVVKAGNLDGKKSKIS
jgi:hypothetical protein